MSDQFPMCWAVCVCGKSDWETKHLLPVSIACFKRQTYSQRRLLLVTEVENAHKLGQFNGDDVTILAVKDNPPLGTLRNAAIRFVGDQMPGGYLLQWDADDYHAAERMAMQMQACLAVPGVASFLKRQIAYSFSQNVAFVRGLRLYGGGRPPEGVPTMIHGTVCHPVNEIRYPAISKGEDTPFHAAWEAGPGAVEVDNDARLYVRFAHSVSTSGEAHVLQEHANDPPGTWSLSDLESAYLREVLRWYRQ